MKIKLKSKPIDSFNSMYGFTPNERALLNQGKKIEVKKISEVQEEFVVVIKEKEKKNGTK